MSVILRKQIFAPTDWGEAFVSDGTATVVEQFAFAVMLTGTLTQGATISVVEQNASHTTLNLICIGTGANNGFIVVDSCGRSSHR